VQQPAAPFVLSLGVRSDVELGWASELAPILALRERPIELDAAVTFLVGENGSGKSTLIEALARATGFGSGGGSMLSRFWASEASVDLHKALLVERSRMKPLNGFFLRAESFVEFAAAAGGHRLEDVYERPLDEQSHGESFLALALERFGPRGFYLLDEPEAALSVTGQLALMCRMRDLVEAHSQFVAATHSPILLGYPGARIYHLGPDGIEQREYEETDQYLLTRSFLEDRERFLHHLFLDD
jgi:predicted ATPase